MTAQNGRIKKPYFHANHKKPMTRRDLLAQGFMSAGCYAAMPGILTMLSRKAMGQDGLVCTAQSGDRMVPFIVVDLAGGANVAGTNVVVGKRGGQKDFLNAGSYSSIGLAPGNEPQDVTLDESMGLAFHPQSQMLAGINQVAQATTLQAVDGALFCTASGDDTGSNPHNPLYWIAKTGLSGELVSLIGTDDSQSGGNANAPDASVDPSLQPSRITQPQDALGLVDKGKLEQILSGDDVSKILKAKKMMSESQLRRFKKKALPDQVEDLIRCGYVNSSNYLSNFTPSNLDPSQDDDVTTVFPNLANDGTQRQAGSIAKLVLDGYAGGGVIEMGGYDYHGRGRGTQDQRDLEAGQVIGRVLELAAVKQQDVMVYVYTDGGVSAAGNGDVDGVFPFRSDSGVRSAAFSLVYQAGGNGRPPIVSERGRQIGSYKDSGSVDQETNQISSNVVNLSKAIVANYLALHGREGDLEKVVGDNPFGSELEQYLAFSKMA